ncbi:hypothetical protein [Spiroplasma sp. AdecLV25b]|uniref:hypothetical protein n=1 Tax=Spiroplasma sp. AdecLV25b TaxID=3027162 RepID=UPI0027DF0AF5|nr:hypothetical protein [Spiroplasma sp. AdecLV25b]
MKNCNLWFIRFFLLLAVFLIYQLVYLIFLSKNYELRNLYTNGFEIVVPTSSFNPSSYGAVFYVPVIGLAISSIAFIGCVFTSRIFIDKSPRVKLMFLVATFSIFIIGFLINFAGELFYSEWNNKIAIIQPKNLPTGVTFTANHFYQNWVASLAIVWSIFGIFFAMLVGCVILLIKLHLINIQMFNYKSQHEKEEHFELELRQPLPSSNEFDPNDSQTITIFLDNENDEVTDLETEDENDEYEEDDKSDTMKIKRKKRKQKS